MVQSFSGRLITTPYLLLYSLFTFCGCLRLESDNFSPLEDVRWMREIEEDVMTSAELPCLHVEIFTPPHRSTEEYAPTTLDKLQGRFPPRLMIRLSSSVLNRDIPLDVELEQNGAILGHSYTDHAGLRPSVTNKHCYYHGRYRAGSNWLDAAVNLCNSDLNGIIHLPDHTILLLHSIVPRTACDAPGQQSTFANVVSVHATRSHDAVSSLTNETIKNCDHHGHTLPASASTVSDLLRSTKQLPERIPLPVQQPSHPSYYSDYDFGSSPNYVELVLVHDKAQYEAYRRNETALHDRSKQLVNIVNMLYRPLNVHIVLMGVEIWKDKDAVAVTDNAEVTLTNFLHYRKQRLVHSMPNDNAQLITGLVFQGGVVGKALKGPMCSYAYSGGVNMDHSASVLAVASTVAHELGHSFGMEHDNDTKECTCDAPSKRCIMSASSSGAPPLVWSKCSLEYLAHGLKHGAAYCLRNEPAKLWDGPTCGNGITEEGEECDCGMPEDCENRCCEAAKCKLAKGAKCATGGCCDADTCMPLPAQTTCRATTNECDLSEHCDGVTEQCPKDVHKADGVGCAGGDAFCAAGQCSTRNDQCKLLWGSTGLVSHDKCFALNTKGSLYGNCGFERESSRYSPCASEDVFCGMLHCEHRNERTEFGDKSVVHTAHTFLSNGQRGHTICRSALVDLGIADGDPGLVPNGAKCGDEKMCYNQKCVDVSTVAQRLPCKANCHGNGICNSRGNCHCFPGYAPPDCISGGMGGSIDSGPVPPAGINLGLAVLIFILVVVPLIAILATLFHRYRHRLGLLGRCYKLIPLRSSSPFRRAPPSFPKPRGPLPGSKAASLSNVVDGVNRFDTVLEISPPQTTTTVVANTSPRTAVTPRGPLHPPASAWSSRVPPPRPAPPQLGFIDEANLPPPDPTPPNHAEPEPSLYRNDQTRSLRRVPSSAADRPNKPAPPPPSTRVDSDYESSQPSRSATPLSPTRKAPAVPKNAQMEVKSSANEVKKLPDTIVVKSNNSTKTPLKPPVMKKPATGSSATLGRTALKPSTTPAGGSMRRSPGSRPNQLPPAPPPKDDENYYDDICEAPPDTSSEDSLYKELEQYVDTVGIGKQNGVARQSGASKATDKLAAVLKNSTAKPPPLPSTLPKKPATATKNNATVHQSTVQQGKSPASSSNLQQGKLASSKIQQSRTKSAVQNNQAAPSATDDDDGALSVRDRVARFNNRA